MENASKALIMAGSILMALLVIGIVSLTYNQLSNLKQTESDVERSTKATNYAKKFEQYNKTIYGSELLSLGNLQADYNDRQADMQGYNRINIKVQIKKEVKGNKMTYVSAGERNISEVRSGLSSLEDDISYYETDSNGYENKIERNKRSVKYYAQLSNRQIATLFEIPYSSDDKDYEIGEKLADSNENPRTSRLLQDIDLYKNLKTTYTEFKMTSFTCKEVKYDDIGRITLMYFVENEK